MRLAALVLALAIATPVAAADYDFDSTVSTLETRLETRRTRVTLLGFGLALAGGVARPLGAKNFQMAIFDRHRISDPTDVDIAQDLGPSWRTIVRVTHPGREQTVIYAQDEGNWVKLFLVTLNSADAVAMQFRLKPTALLRFVAQCQQRGH